MWRPIRAGIAAVTAALLCACTLPEVERGERFAKNGHWDDALAEYRAAAKKRPGDDGIAARVEEAKVRSAADHYAGGQRHLEEHRVGQALEDFKRAVGLNPAHRDYYMAMTEALRLKEANEQFALGRKLETLGRPDEALNAYQRAVELNPDLTPALDRITAVSEAHPAGSLFPARRDPVTLRFQNARPREVFQVLARAGGINVLFDREVREEPITIFLTEAPFDEAFKLLLNLSGLFAVSINPTTVLVAPNTKAKHEQYQDHMIRTFYLSNAKAKDMVNLVKTMLESKRIFVNEPLNALVVRDTPVKLQLAERIIQANDRREPEVELDVEVLEVNRTKSQQLGVDFAKLAGAAAVPPGFVGGVAAAATNFTFRQLSSLGKDSYLFSLPSSLLVDFFKQDSDAKTLASPKLRVLNGKQASVNIGDKQPILLSTTNVLPGQAATGAVPTTSTVTSIEFRDTGVKLTVEPVIHLADEVTLKLKIEVTRLGDLVTLQASPEIKQFRFGTRTAETTLNLRDDEAVVLAGLIQDEDRKVRTGVPWLSDIPVLGHLFSRQTQDRVTTEVILTITPHLVRNVVMPSLEGQAVWSGNETDYATRPMFPRGESGAEGPTVERPSAALPPAADAPAAGVDGAPRP